MRMESEMSLPEMMRAFCGESGLDMQFDLRAYQCAGIAEGETRKLRVWFNDGRIRDWDCGKWLAKVRGRAEKLVDAETFAKSATVWDGAPGFDLGECHAVADCIDFDPLVVWTESKDVTRLVLCAEAKADQVDPGVSNGRALCVAESPGAYGA